MNLYKQIRANRLRLNMTQEKLAEKLNVTAQAVSKWESGSGMPDITLLPELAAVFGVTIDALFETSEEMQLNRIEAMVEKETMLSHSDFDYAVSCLEGLRHNTEHKGRCLTLLADLHLHRANGLLKKLQNMPSEHLTSNPKPTITTGSCSTHAVAHWAIGVVPITLASLTIIRYLQRITLHICPDICGSRTT